MFFDVERGRERLVCRLFGLAVRRFQIFAHQILCEDKPDNVQY